MNSTRTPRKTSRILPALILLALAAVFAVVFTPVWGSWRKSTPTLSASQLTPVRRASLDVTVRAGGEIESVKKTLIECELEQIGVRSKGSSINSSGYSTILTLTPEGTMVKKDDVLCTLDASEYEELHKQAKIYEDRARADKVAADLQLDVAVLAKKEYLQGTAVKTLEQMEGQIALSEADIVRFKDRLVWSEKMNARGYIPLSQVTSERLALKRAEFDLSSKLGSRKLFKAFTMGRTLQQLESAIIGQRYNVRLYTDRLKMAEERVVSLAKQMDRCVVKAPHDGRLIYAKTRDGKRIETGTPVYNDMDLFILPDLSRMQVLAKLNESVVDRVKPGMPAQVRIEANPREVYPAQVVDIEEFPVYDESKSVGITVNNYLAKVELIGRPEGLLPGMLAEVEILTASSPDRLVVPYSALVVENGRSLCYAIDENEGLVIRPVKLGQSNEDWVEVLDGLEEGETIVSDQSALKEEDIENAQAANSTFTTDADPTTADGSPSSENVADTSATAPSQGEPVVLSTQ